MCQTIEHKTVVELGERIINVEFINGNTALEITSVVEKEQEEAVDTQE